MKKGTIFRYIFGFIILAALCWFFPYSGDDWAWGSSIGLERLAAHFDNYSGRYFGNMIVLVLTRSNILKALAMSFCLMGIIGCLEYILQKKWMFYFSACFMLLVPKTILRQAVVWTAGFSNYTTSIFFTLVYIAYIWWIFDDEKYKKRLKQNIPIAILLIFLGMTNTLIVEHLTIYNVVLAIGVIIFVFIKYRKILIQHLCYLAGTLSGTYLMFSNSVYHSISTNSDGYRSVAEGGVLKQAFDSYFDVIYEEGYLKNIWLNAAIAIVCFLLYQKSKQNFSFFTKKILGGCLCLISLYSAYSFFSVIGLSEATKQDSLRYLEGAASLISLLALILFILITSVKYNRFWHNFFITGSILCIIAPLFVVNPIGSRCFYPVYIMFILLFGECTDMLDETKALELIFQPIIPLFRTVILSGIIFYFCIYISVWSAGNKRLDYINKHIAAGDKKIEILHLPYESYIWTPTPAGGDVWEERYKLFYNLPEDIELTPVWEYSK